MNQYGKTALKAVHFYQTLDLPAPRDAWVRAAVETFGRGTTSMEKSCPRDTFLGLCEEGLVKGIPAGSYTRSVKNKRYALNAVSLLKNNPELAHNAKKLWKMVMAGEDKSHNAQMDVVTALWKAGLITGSAPHPRPRRSLLARLRDFFLP
jgi:hypothetical protein